MVYNDKQWRSLFEALGEPEKFEQDRRFSSQGARLEHIDEVYGFLVRLLETRRENQVDLPISEVMTPRPNTVTPESPLADAIGILSQYRISELPVVDADGRPAGLVDITDLVGLVPEEKLE